MSSNEHVVQRVKIVKNASYTRDGLKSYGHLLRKYNFVPTIAGPFAVVEQLIEAEAPRHRNLLKLFHHKHYQQTQHCLVKSSAGTGQVGTVAAQDVQNDTQYTAPVTIGGQTLNLYIPPGPISILGRQTCGAGLPTCRQKFSVKTWHIQYGDGSTASGVCGTDGITLGGISVKNQCVEIADKLSESFVHGSGCDGLLGLAFDTINCVQPTPAQTPVDNMCTQSNMSLPVFTAHLGSYRDTNDPDHGESFYTFGFIDQDVVKHCGGTIYYAPVDNSNGFWQVKSTSCVVNGNVIALPSTNAGIMDTGTTLALVDDQTLQAIYAAIPGAYLDSSQQGYCFPNNLTNDQLPLVQFDIGGNLVTMEKGDLGFADLGNGMVYGSIQSAGNMGMSIFGDALLKSIYAIFDVGNQRFGSCQRRDTTEDPGPSASQSSNPQAMKADMTQRSDQDGPVAKAKAAVARAAEALHDTVTPANTVDNPVAATAPVGPESAAESRHDSVVQAAAVEDPKVTSVSARPVEQADIRVGNIVPTAAFDQPVVTPASARTAKTADTL